MSRYVVLLRGVNVGKGNRVPMAIFREILEGVGCRDVRTLLNSGNAVCDSATRSAATLGDSVRKALAERLAIDVPVVVVPRATFAIITDDNPLAVACTDPSRLLVAFPETRDALPPLEALAALVQRPERLEVGAHAAYLWCPNGILESKTALALLGKAGRGVTTRNWATVLKLRAWLD